MEEKSYDSIRRCFEKKNDWLGRMEEASRSKKVKPYMLCPCTKISPDAYLSLRKKRGSDWTIFRNRGIDRKKRTKKWRRDASTEQHMKLQEKCQKIPHSLLCQWKPLEKKSPAWKNSKSNAMCMSKAMGWTIVFTGTYHWNRIKKKTLAMAPATSPLPITNCHSTTSPCQYP